MQDTQQLSSYKIIFVVLGVSIVAAISALVILHTLSDADQDENRIKNLVAEAQKQFDNTAVEKKPELLKEIQNKQKTHTGQITFNPTKYSTRELITVHGVDKEYIFTADLTPRSKKFFGNDFNVKSTLHNRHKRQRHLPKTSVQFLIDYDFASYPVRYPVDNTKITGSVLVKMLMIEQFIMVVTWSDSYVNYTLSENCGLGWSETRTVGDELVTEPRVLLVEPWENQVVLIINSHLFRYDTISQEWLPNPKYIPSIMDHSVVACISSELDFIIAISNGRTMEVVHLNSGTSTVNTTQMESEHEIINIHTSSGGESIVEICICTTENLHRLQWCTNTFELSDQGTFQTANVDSINICSRNTLCIVSHDKSGVDFMSSENDMEAVRILTSINTLSNFHLFKIGNTPCLLYVDETKKELLLAQSELPCGQGIWRGNKLILTQVEEFRVASTTAGLGIFHRKPETDSWSFVFFPTCTANVEWNVYKII
jgi:hypothetical protein